MVEAIGRRGISQPELVLRWGVPPAALVVGGIGGMWHVPACFQRGRQHDADVPGWLALVCFLLQTTALLVLYALILVRMNGSVIAAMLAHNASQMR